MYNYKKHSSDHFSPPLPHHSNPNHHLCENAPYWQFCFQSCPAYNNCLLSTPKLSPLLKVWMRLYHSDPYLPLVFHYTWSSSAFTWFRCMAPTDSPQRNGSMANQILKAFWEQQKSKQGCNLSLLSSTIRSPWAGKFVSKGGSTGSKTGPRFGTHSVDPILCSSCLRL